MLLICSIRYDIYDDGDIHNEDDDIGDDVIQDDDDDDDDEDSIHGDGWWWWNLIMIATQIKPLLCAQRCLELRLCEKFDRGENITSNKHDFLSSL